MKIQLNDNYRNLKESYLFSEIAKRVSAYAADHPNNKIIRLGIGDVTLPLTPTVITAMEKAVGEMAVQETFRGYPPESGFDFTRKAVADYYARRGTSVRTSEIFISDGAKSDCGNLTDILGDNPVLIPDPVYPVYLDSNIMCGRKVTFLPSGVENGFLPMPNGLSGEGAVIYLCSPNNPTGAVYDKQQLAAWVEFARRTGSLILFDAAYEAFIVGDYPHSIFEIEGARECAIEICSFSKTAGFTGTRCSWTVVPEELKAGGVSLRNMWERRQATKFNGVPYIVQRAAEAALTEQGIAECRGLIAYYMENAKLIAGLLQRKGIFFTGGQSSPYLWLRCPGGMDSWTFFDYLLQKAEVVGTPGSGFGSCGEGFFRLTAFGSHEGTAEAVARLEKLL